MEHECEYFIPRGLINAMIGMMVFFVVANVLILVWMGSRFSVSPGDVQESNRRESQEIISLLDQLDRRLVIIEEEIKNPPAAPK